MPGLSTLNTQIFHASSIGRQGYVVLAPNTPATNVGCAVVYRGLSGTTQESTWSALPVMERPAALPGTPSVVSIDSLGAVSYITTASLAAAVQAVRYTPQTLTVTEQQQARENIGIFNPQLQPQSGWQVSQNYIVDRNLDADNTTLQGLCDTVATIIEDLRAANIFTLLPSTPNAIVTQAGWTTTNWTPVKAIDGDTTPFQLLCDIVATIINDLKLANVFA